jgi:molybdopterin-containing oxidoreductase family iron-sulfur binding subunit
MSQRKNLAGELAALETARGRKYWRSLEELADNPAFQELMRGEFPEQASVWPDTLSRRKFLTLMGASLALAGVSGCSTKPAPSVDLVPYVRAPEALVPGKPLFFSTAMTLGGAGVGLLVESHQGRPTKIEGNPDHPASLGATDVFSQASILTLYDPDRSQNVTYLGKTRTWDEALGALRKALGEQRSRRGAGLRLLTETVVSPALADQVGSVLKAYPEAKWHQYEPLAPTPLAAPPCWHSARTSTPTTTFARPTWSCPSTPISWRAARPACVTPPTSCRAGACAKRAPPRRG